MSIQVGIDQQSYLAEVLFYMLLKVGDTVKPVTLISFYGPPHTELYKASFGTYWMVQHLRDSAIRVVDIKAIKATVMLALDQRYPLFFNDGSEVDRWYLMEKPGLKLSQMIGLDVLMTDE